MALVVDVQQIAGLANEGGDFWARIIVHDSASAAYPSGGYALPPSLFGFTTFMRQKLGGIGGNDVVFPTVMSSQKSAAAPVCDIDFTTGTLKFFTNAGAELAANAQTQNLKVELEAFGH